MKARLSTLQITGIVVYALVYLFAIVHVVRAALSAFAFSSLSGLIISFIVFKCIGGLLGGAFLVMDYYRNELRQTQSDEDSL